MTSLTVVIVIIIIWLVLEHAFVPTPFVSAGEFQRIAAADEYFQRMSAHDLVARGAASREEYLARYLESAKDWSAAEQQWMHAVIQEATRRIRRANLTFILRPWRFAKIGSYASERGEQACSLIEMGYPHTLRDVIVWTETTLKKSFEEQVGLAAHELTHVFQRNNKALSNELISRSGFRRTSFIPSKFIRNNPDQDETVWVNTNNTILGVCYRSSTPCDISDCIGEDHPMEQMAYYFEELVKNA